MEKVKNPMTVKALIAALSELNPDAVVTINVKQHNRVYGRQLQIDDTMKRGDIYQSRVDASYTGACITLSLPEKAIFSHWPEKD